MKNEIITNKTDNKPTSLPQFVFLYEQECRPQGNRLPAGIYLLQKCYFWIYSNIDGIRWYQIMSAGINVCLKK